MEFEWIYNSSLTPTTHILNNFHFLKRSRLDLFKKNTVNRTFKCNYLVTGLYLRPVLEAREFTKTN